VCKTAAASRQQQVKPTRQQHQQQQPWRGPATLSSPRSTHLEVSHVRDDELLKEGRAVLAVPLDLAHVTDVKQGRATLSAGVQV
jgi:hypothetical protein